MCRYHSLQADAAGVRLYGNKSKGSLVILSMLVNGSGLRKLTDITPAHFLVLRLIAVGSYGRRRAMDRHISVVINTYNAERYLRRVLEHVKRFDEIVVCDMESTDDTLSIAREFNCKIVTFPKGEHRICEPARDFAIHSATHNWVLIVDADEIIPSSLMDYLYDMIEDPDFDALEVPRINKFMGVDFPEPGDYTIRLMRKDKTRWPPVIHSLPHVEGIVKRIPHRRELSILHLYDPEISRWIEKFNTYTDYHKTKKASRKCGFLKVFTRPILAFIKSYVLQRGFLHGRTAVLHAYMVSLYQIILLA